MSWSRYEFHDSLSTCPRPPMWSECRWVSTTVPIRSTGTSMLLMVRLAPSPASTRMYSPPAMTRFADGRRSEPGCGDPVPSVNT